MNRARSGAVVLAGMWSALSFAGAVGAALPAGVRACMGERDDARRLSCFDRETARLTQPEATTARAPDAPSTPAPASPAASAAAPKATPAAPTLSGEEKFGYRADRRKAEEGELDQLTAKVVEVSALAHGQFVAKLDNGQVWQQKQIDRSVRLKVGEEVTIRRASFGSFMLVTASGKSTRVTRAE